jgi:hypothetical protein
LQRTLRARNPRRNPDACNAYGTEMQPMGRLSLTKRYDTRRVTGDWIAWTVSVLPVTGGGVRSDDGVRAQHDPGQTDRHHSRRCSDVGSSPHLMGTSLPAPGCRRGRSRSSVGAGPFEAVLERPSGLHRDNPPGARRGAFARRCSSSLCRRWLTSPEMRLRSPQA